MLIPTLYVGSFAYLVADEVHGWGLVRSLDDRTLEVLTVIYWPLIWLVQNLPFAGF